MYDLGISIISSIIKGGFRLHSFFSPFFPVDPYVRVDVWIGKKLKLKKKTFFLKQEQNPVFNQKMEFHASAKDLENVKIVLTIATYLFAQDGSLQHGVMPLHKLEFGEKSTDSCMEHWRTATTVNKPIAKWHVFC